jgi:hypothetical protein
VTLVETRVSSRTVPSREVQGIKKAKSPKSFFEGPGTPRPLFLDRILPIKFKTKVHH